MSKSREPNGTDKNEALKALSDLLDCLVDSDDRPEGEVTMMRGIGIVSCKRTFDAIDRAKAALRRSRGVAV